MPILVINSFILRLIFPCQPFETGKIIGSLFLFYLSWLFFMFARKRTRVFLYWYKDKEKKYSSMAFAFLFLVLGLLMLMSAMFGWTC